MSISRLKYGETKNLGKHLVGKGKGITFAIPNDEVWMMRERGRNEEKGEGNEVERGIKIFENNGTKVADGLFY